MSFNIKQLVVAIATTSIAAVASGAGLDRSGQDMSAFFQEGTYAEISYTQIDADVTGHDNSNLLTGDGSQQALSDYRKGRDIGDIAESYNFVRYGVKADIDENVSIGVLVDEPFGAKTKYSGNNNFVADASIVDAFVNNATGGQVTSAASLPATINALERAGRTQDANRLRILGGIAGGISNTDKEATQVEVHSSNITGLVGLKIGDNFQIYGGPAYQRIEGDVKLRGPAYLTSTGYDAVISPDGSLGWVAGGAFMKPEIALRAALTYRSEIEHENSINEFYNGDGQNQGGTVNITTPESFNFDFQTGVNKTTLATAKVRYVPWSDFAIVPPLYNQRSKIITQDNKGLPLVGYSDDQWQVELGLAKRLSPALAVSGSLGWDSGAGNPTTSLGPIEGYYSVGAGAKFNMTPNWALSAGAKYLMFGDAKGALPNGKVVGNFEDNDGYAVGVKLSYQER